MSEFVKLVVDGSCIRQQDCGGWAYRFEWHDRVFKDSGGEFPATNNTMELEAARQGLIAVKRHTRRDIHLLVISDSRYVTRGASEWLPLWRERRWITQEGKPVSNRSQWEEIDRLATWFDRVVWKWVKGHQGHELNEIVDEMARDAARLMQRQRPV